MLQRCYGCGAVLQTVEEGSPGYVPPEKYSLKQQHRQLGTVICRHASLLPLWWNLLKPRQSRTWRAEYDVDLSMRLGAAIINHERLSAACRRCQELSNGSMVQGVADLWGRDADTEELRLVSPEQLRTQLAQVRNPLLPLRSIHRLHSTCAPVSMQSRMADGGVPWFGCRRDPEKLSGCCRSGKRGQLRCCWWI